mgnify:CR=1 FL=1
MMMNGWSSGKSDGGDRTKEARKSTSGSTLKGGSRVVRQRHEAISESVSESTKSKIVIKKGRAALA